VAYENLARLSILVDAARDGERNDRHHTHFEELFDRLQNDSAGGVYTLMCALRTVLPPLVDYRPNVPILDRYRINEIRRIRVPLRTCNDRLTNAQRHIRDYRTVMLLKNVAARLLRDVEEIAKHYQ